MPVKQRPQLTGMLIEMYQIIMVLSEKKSPANKIHRGIQLSGKKSLLSLQVFVFFIDQKDKRNYKYKVSNKGNDRHHGVGVNTRHTGAE